jgi:glycosyltransferase involved in cell wall biosynthesis
MKNLKIDWPLVSICIPVHNCRPFIERSVHSALTQDYPNFEVIICDDHSNDGTWEFLQQIKDPRVRVFRNQKNLGAFGNHNQTVSHARGEFIKFLHSDDELPQSTISYMVPWLLRYPSVVAVAVPLVFIDENSRTIGKSPAVNGPLLVRGHDLLRQMWLKGNSVGCTGNILLRKISYLAVNGAPEHMMIGGDWDLFARLSFIGNWIFLPGTAYRYRAENITSTWGRYRTIHHRVIYFKEQLSTATYDESNKGYGLSKKEIRRWQASICGNAIVDGLLFYRRQRQTDLFKWAICEANRRGLIVTSFWHLLTRQMPKSIRYMYFRHRTGCGYKPGESLDLAGIRLNDSGCYNFSKNG